jgi:hypothetical protein
MIIIETMHHPSTCAIYRKLLPAKREWIDDNRTLLAKCLRLVRKQAGKLEAYDLRDALSTCWGYWPAKEREVFALANDPPAHIPQRFDNQTASAQRKLIEGMDCLPGQLDLF